MHSITVQSSTDRLVPSAILLILCLVFSVLLTACGSTEAEAPVPTDTSIPLTPTTVPPTATPLPPTAASASPTLTPEPPTPNALQAAMTYEALTREVATPMPTATPVPTTCEEVEGICLWVYFDGEECAYNGPIEITSGQVALLFVNDSEVRASANLWKHNEGRTFEEMIAYLEQETPPEAHPPWSNSVFGVWGLINAGGSRVWEGVLYPGIYTVVCGSEALLGALYGTGLAVKE